MITFPTEADLRAALTSASNVEALIETILAKIPTKVSGPYPVALLLNKEGTAFSQFISLGSDSEFVEVLINARLAAGATTSVKAVHENTPVYVADIDKDPHDWEDMPGLWWGFLANWTAPLCASDGRVFGAVSLYFGMPRDPTSPEKEAFEDFARCLASAVQSYLR